jgi:hypothetical protein
VQGGRAIRVHEIELEIRVYEIELETRPEEIPLRTLRPDPWLGNERLGQS